MMCDRSHGLVLLLLLSSREAHILGGACSRVKRGFWTWTTAEPPRFLFAARFGEPGPHAARCPIVDTVFRAVYSRADFRTIRVGRVRARTTNVRSHERGSSEMRGLYEFFHEGGIFMLVNLVVSAFVVGVVAERLFFMATKYRVNSREFLAQIRKLVQAGNIDRAIKLCEAAPLPL